MVLTRSKYIINEGINCGVTLVCAEYCTSWCVRICGVTMPGPALPGGESGQGEIMCCSLVAEAVWSGHGQLEDSDLIDLLKF